MVIRRRQRSAFIWIPRSEPIAWKYEIDGVDQTIKTLNISWTKVATYQMGTFSMLLNNINGDFTDLYSGGETVKIYLDYKNAAKKVFEGKIEKITKQFSNNYTIQIVGSHVSGELLDLTVTESYSETNVSTILKDLVDNYLTGYTYVNVKTINKNMTVNWSNKPFWDCVIDICRVADADAYVDDSKDIHFFTQGSITNDDEAIVWNDNLLDISELGKDTIDVKNKTIVYGKDTTGLPVIYTDISSASQTTYGIKEQIIRDTNVQDFVQAGSLAIAKSVTEPEDKGSVKSLIMPGLNPGDKIWISDPTHKIHDRYRIVKFTHSIPAMTTNVIISEERSIPLIFKARIEKEMALEDIENPNKMLFSENYTFDDETKTSTKSTNLVIEDSELRMTSGNTGTFESTVTKISELTNLTQVYILVIGENITNAEFWVSNDNKNSWKSIKLEELTFFDSTGNQLALKIRLNSTNTTINGVAVLVK